MNHGLLLKSAPVAFALAVSPAFAQVVADAACPQYRVDIAAYASCDGDQVARFASDDRSSVTAKISHSGLQVTAVDAYRLLTDPAARAVLVDVRSGLEVARRGAPFGVTLHLPYAEPTPQTPWDPEREQWPMIANPEFGAQLLKELAARGIGPDHTVIFICRSGERSARAADELADFGYKTATVADGFEGDRGPDHRRSVNGWKNAGLPWIAGVELAAHRGR